MSRVRGYKTPWLRIAVFSAIAPVVVLAILFAGGGVIAVLIAALVFSAVVSAIEFWLVFHRRGEDARSAGRR